MCSVPLTQTEQDKTRPTSPIGASSLPEPVGTYWGISPKGKTLRLYDLDTEVNVHDRREKLLDFVATEKLKRTLHSKNEITMKWFHRDISQVPSNSKAIPKRNLKVQNLLDSHATNCEPYDDSSDVELIEVKRPISPIDVSGNILPLVPDFTGF